MMDNRTILRMVIEKAISDSVFRSQLIRDYRPAIKSLGHGEVKFQNNKQILFVDQSNNKFSDKFITETPQNIIISIPGNTNNIDRELSSSELDDVTGGLIIWPLKKIIEFFD